MASATEESFISDICLTNFVNNVHLIILQNCSGDGFLTPKAINKLTWKVVLKLE